MATNERGPDGSREELTSQGQRKGAARRNLPRVDFEELNFEQRRPPYNSNDREMGGARNEGEPQQAGRRNQE